MGASPDALTDAVGMGIDWLAAHGGRLMANIDHRFSYWIDPPNARHVLTTQAAATWVSSVSSYHDNRRERRTAGVASPNQVRLTSLAGAVEWRDTVAELREIMLAASIRGLSIAMLTHHDWAQLLNTSRVTCFDRRALDDHPEVWDQFTLDPCGVQVLTDQHLAKAHDLSDWTTTRLDEHHYLLEARDLTPWYATPRRRYDPPDDLELLHQARTDFGDMILTHAIAAELGIAGPPG